MKLLKLSIFLGLVVAGLFGGFGDALAAPGDVSGYAWSSTIGWISFAGNNNPSSGGGNYQVRIDPNTGVFSGYAWSSNIGWISFCSESNTANCPNSTPDLAGCPSGPCSARRNGDRVEGWARALAAPTAGANAGGWTGWIQLDDLQISSTPNADGLYEFNGWAWGGGGSDPAPNFRNQIIGWVSFNSNNPGAGGGDYRVVVDNDGVITCPGGSLPPCPGGNPPDDVVIEPGVQDYCSAPLGGEFVYRINARPSGGDGEVSVEHNLAPANTVNESPSRVNLPGNFDILLYFDNGGWNEAYRYSVEVGSIVSNDINFTTPHQRPGLEYTMIDRPDLGDNFFEFEAIGSCYDPSGCSYNWTFNGGTPSFAPGRGPHEVEFVSGSVEGVLNVTNRGDGYSCPAPFGGSGTVLPLPQWREVSPFRTP